jgi:hypothetical protein
MKMKETDGRRSQILKRRLFDHLVAGRLDHRRTWLATTELRNAPRGSHSVEISHGSITGSDGTRRE